MMNEWNKINAFLENRSSLKNTSLDDHNKENPIYMLEYSNEVVDFDKAKEAYLKTMKCQSEELMSADALWLHNEKTLLIEFKNGSLKKAAKDIKNKLKDSVFILADITSNNIDTIRKNVEFILVYNEEKNQSSSKLKIANGITKLAGEEFLRFGLDKYRGLFFSKAHTYTRTEFENFCRENQLQLEK